MISSVVALPRNDDFVILITDMDIRFVYSRKLERRSYCLSISRILKVESVHQLSASIHRSHRNTYLNLRFFNLGDFTDSNGGRWEGGGVEEGPELEASIEFDPVSSACFGRFRILDLVTALLLVFRRPSSHIFSNGSPSGHEIPRLSFEY
jgi:hypothetical protein